MIPGTMLIVIMVAGVAVLALWPGARIPRVIKVLLRRFVLRPKVRLYLNLDPIAPPLSLRALQNLVGTWTQATFVRAGGIGACNHIKDEVEEVKEILRKIMDCQTRGEPINPADQYQLDLELADLQILIMDIAHGRGTDLTDATLLKHSINTCRKWAAPDERGVQHHIEEGVKDTISGRTPEQELALLKNMPELGKAKLAAILARPDATIAAALAEVLNEAEPLQGMGSRGNGDFKP